MGSRKTPEIRFAGFNDDWNQLRLGEVVHEVSGNDGRTNLPVLTISAGNGWMNQEERFSKVIAGNELKNYTLLKEGELSYNHGNSKLAMYGAVFELRQYSEALVPKVYHSFKTNSYANSSFLEYLFASKIPDRELRKLISSGARMDGLLNINRRDFFSIKLIIPSEKEQIHIGDFLKQLDNTIAIHQSDLDHLKQVKQGFLQKMLPIEGETVPEIRFSGFANHWEEWQLSDITNKIGSGKTPKGGNAHYQSQGIPLLRSQNIINDTVNLNDIVYISTEMDNEMANSRVQQNDVLLNITGASIGRSAVYELDLDANVNQHVCIIRPIKFDPHFIQLNLTSKAGQKKIELNQAGGGREGLNFQQIARFKFFFPSLEEQVQISSFFKRIDNMIAFKAREIDLLKATKKAFLQKMFI